MHTLESLLEHAERLGRKLVRYHELREQVLLYDGPGGYREVRLRTPRGSTTGNLARAILYDQRAEVAVLIFEGWMANLTPDDPRLVLLNSGRLRVSQLQPPDRYDSLTLVGETAAHEEAYRAFRLDPPQTPNGARVVVALSEQASLAAGSFRPLFVSRSDIERVLDGRTPLAEQHHRDQALAKIERLAARRNAPDTQR